MISLFLLMHRLVALLFVVKGQSQVMT